MMTVLLHESQNYLPNLLRCCGVLVCGWIWRWHIICGFTEGSTSITYSSGLPNWREHLHNFGVSGFWVNLVTNKWTKIKNLGNKSLFLGFSSSLSVDASSNSYCKPNCIYFTDDFVDSYWLVPGLEGIRWAIVWELRYWNLYHGRWKHWAILWE